MANSLKKLTKGMEVEYVLKQGTHLPATITHIWHKENGVVDLRVVSDESPEGFNVSTVLYFQEPVANTWHWKQ